MAKTSSALQEICTSCEDVTSNAIQVPCSHHYCLTCLERFFKLALTDQSVFPPRCCSIAIPIVSVSSFLKPSVVQRFEEKKFEFKTRYKVYCSSKRCSTVIPPSNIVKEIGTCPKCNVKTHTLCKSKAHSGECLKDASIEEVLDLARDNYWQRCYKCWALVDIIDGCHFMTCLCGAHFCYNCGKGLRLWNRHSCDLRKRRLLARFEPRSRSWSRLFTRIFRSSKS